MRYDNDQICFARLHPNALLPEKRQEDAGYDLFAVTGSDLALPPYQAVKVPTGIASAFPQSYVAIIKERSGLGAKNIGVRGGVIDSGYRGEWQVVLTNYNDEPVVLPAGKAVAQFLLLPLASLSVKEISPAELEQYVSQRGASGFGSTDDGR